MIDDLESRMRRLEVSQGQQNLALWVLFLCVLALNLVQLVHLVGR